MATKIQVFRSFSCNNSSSYRLVAKFADASKAEEVGKELDEFFKTHAKEMDTALEAGEGYPETPLPSDVALAAKYGFEWTDALAWGDDRQEGDEPQVFVEGNTVIAWHTYCNGFGGSMPKYLASRGGNVEPEGFSGPNVSILFRLPDDADKSQALRDQMTKIFSTIKDGQIQNATVPWSSENVWGETGFFCDGKSMGVYVSIDPTEIARLKTWLLESGVDKPVLQISEASDHLKFNAIAAARCSACKSTLEYLDPRVHQIEAEQLACTQCGGMFELKPILEDAAAAMKKG